MGHPMWMGRRNVLSPPTQRLVRRAGVVFIPVFLAIVSLTGCAGPSSCSANRYTEQKWRFIVTGDSRGNNNGVNTAILGELAAEVVKKQVDFVLLSGDLVNGYVNQAELENQLKTWRDTMQPVYDAGIGVYVVRGNHDLGEPIGVTAWNNVFKDKFSLPGNGPVGEKNLTYSVEHKNALVVGVDEYVRLRRVNQGWLDSQFAANTKPHVFVFGHEPAFKAMHEDCLDDYAAERDTFWVSIEKAGGRIYFCGHDHFYDHAVVDDDGDPGNDIHQCIVATTGAPLYNWSGKYDGENSRYTVKGIYHSKEYGYCLVKINGLDVTVTWTERVGARLGAKPRAGKYKAREVWSYTASVP
ncbi:MAG: metallophosphoesterase, partial [Sedimentisphaerales bacterium]|nr:metallophosphoesterase [Sedimentisphaerales bacterium]